MSIDPKEAALMLADWWWPDMAHDPMRTEQLVRLVANALLAVPSPSTDGGDDNAPAVAAPFDPWQPASEARCTCRSGRDFDGSEFGPCEYCERIADEETSHRALVRDAARWRISRIRYPRRMDSPFGYFAVSTDEWVDVGIQPHPVTKATGINHCIMGRGKTTGEAIDGMFASLSAYVSEGKVLPDEIESIRELFTEADAPPGKAASSPTSGVTQAGVIASEPPPPSDIREALEKAAKVCERRASRHAEDRKRIEATSGHDPRMIDACIAAEDEGNEAADEIRALDALTSSPPGDGKLREALDHIRDRVRGPNDGLKGDIYKIANAALSVRDAGEGK